MLEYVPMAHTLTTNSNFVFFVAAVAALAGLLFGFDTGVISGALLYIRPHFHLDPSGEGLVVSGVLIGATFSSILSGRLTDYFGRKKVILATAIVFAIGSIVCALAQSVNALFVGRLVLGLAIGVASYAAPLYISEVAPPDRRGQLVGLNQLFIVLGILLSYVVDYAFSESGSWQMMVAFGALPAIILGVAIIWMPESPRWLTLNNREEEAKSVLTKVRGGADVSSELAEIKMGLKEEQGDWREFFSKKMRPALVVGIGLGLFQQFTGINTVIYYAPTIFQLAGFQSNSVSILATAGVGLVNVLMTVVGLFLIDRVGRRPLLLIGIAGMTFALLALSASFALNLDAEVLKLVGIGSLALYVASFAISLGPIFWLMISEIYPLRIRGFAMSFATGMQWASNVVVSYTFPLLLKAIGTPQTFAVYAVIAVGAFFFSLFLVPETKGLSLEQIERKDRTYGVEQPQA